MGTVEEQTEGTSVLIENGSPSKTQRLMGAELIQWIVSENATVSRRKRNSLVDLAYRIHRKSVSSKVIKRGVLDCTKNKKPEDGKGNSRVFNTNFGQRITI